MGFAQKHLLHHNGMSELINEWSQVKYLFLWKLLVMEKYKKLLAYPYQMAQIEKKKIWNKTQ